MELISENEKSMCASGCFFVPNNAPKDLKKLLTFRLI